MFTRTQTLTYKTYDELNPQEQQRVLDKYRFIDVEDFASEWAELLFEDRIGSEEEYGLEFETADRWNIDPRYAHILFTGLTVIPWRMATYFYREKWEPQINNRSQSQAQWRRYRATHRAILSGRIDIKIHCTYVSWSVSQNEATVDPIYANTPHDNDRVNYDLIEQCINQAIQAHADYYIGALQDEYDRLISDAHLEERFSDASLYFETESLEMEWM